MPKITILSHHALWKKIIKILSKRAVFGAKIDCV
jgi:hypothetical protein